jgi:hypothetical protein
MNDDADRLQRAIGGGAHFFQLISSAILLPARAFPARQQTDRQHTVWLPPPRMLAQLNLSPPQPVLVSGGLWCGVLFPTYLSRALTQEIV